MKSFIKTTAWVVALSGLWTGSAFAGTELKGVGSYLAGPLCARWLAEYGRNHHEINTKYELKNSSDGVNQWLGRGADFAATDTPLTLDEERRALGREPLCLPFALEAVAITYNLPDVPSGLRFSPKVLSAIFSGSIQKWNHPDLVELNPGVRLPDMDILVIHREEERTLHDFFPNYLSRLDAKWTAKREKEKDLKWPVGVNAKGNSKVVEKLRKIPGGIAAVDFPYAAEKHLPIGEIKNRSGNFVGPSPESILAATADIVNLPEDFKVWVSHSRDPQAYPLCTFLWLLVYQDHHKAYHNPTRGKVLADFLQWAAGDEGQKLVRDSSYVPLPESFIAQVKSKIQAIRY
jgi:phosphate transport system substrate-binding protein